MNERFVWLDNNHQTGWCVRNGAIACLVSAKAMAVVTYEKRRYKVQFGGQRPPLDWVPQWVCCGDVVTDGDKAHTVFFVSWDALKACADDLRTKWDTAAHLLMNKLHAEGAGLDQQYALYFGK